MPWKPEYAATRRAKYHASEDERERRKKQSRPPEENARYMAAYFQANREKLRRAPGKQASINAQRRERYAADGAYREKCKAEAKAGANPALQRKNRIQAQYGLSPSDYDALLEAQSYQCKICMYPHIEEKQKRLHVDHCHATNRVRGLLCSRCNRGIGHFRDKPSLLTAASKYLEEN